MNADEAHTHSSAASKNSDEKKAIRSLTASVDVACRRLSCGWPTSRDEKGRDGTRSGGGASGAGETAALAGCSRRLGLRPPPCCSILTTLHFLFMAGCCY
ncbi:unnamed protein product [Toxocara canis]|uniref:Uncharacterized protein n=1 Tax=Toxocara canis TaxID=6265 RepID=A0A183UUT6_TOXCA|nr:unnamed protein product [Toxocara canis]